MAESKTKKFTKRLILIIANTGSEKKATLSAEGIGWQVIKANPTIFDNQGEKPCPSLQGRG